ncbi:hypothetical protein ABPG74_022386 [Tetrahymena malaccensis]
MVKQTNSANKDNKNNQTDPDESSENLSKDTKDIFTTKKTKRRSVNQLKEEKTIQCPLCMEKKYASFPALYTHIKCFHFGNKDEQQDGKKQICQKCNRECSSLSSLKTHDFLAHNEQVKQQLQKITNAYKQNNPNEKKPPKGRPPKANKKLSLPCDFEMIDDIEQKYQTLDIFQNENFISVLQNVMFTEGYLCKNNQSLSCEAITKQQITELFNDLKDIFQIEDSLDWLNDQVFDYLKKLSELILYEAFVIIYYAYYNKDYQNLLQISKDLKEDNCHFKLVYEVLTQETQTQKLKEDFDIYFEALHISFQNLISELQNSPSEKNQPQYFNLVE